MTIDPPTLTAISGLGGKGPACFLVEAGGIRLMLDLGYGPLPGLMPNVDGVGKIDALLLTHGHRDHAGSLNLRPQLGDPPVYATDIVARRLPAQIASNPLPLQGSLEIGGIRIQTGRSGHAPGGVWLHLGVGAGLLYMGDYSTESPVYAFDQPPHAGTVIIDASYGDYDGALAESQNRLEQLIRRGPILMPVPADGRGPEIALWLQRRHYSNLLLDDAIRGSLRRLANEESKSVHVGVERELVRLAEVCETVGLPRGISLAATADGTHGASAELLERWEHAREPQIVFTGYVPPGTAAEKLIQSKRASYLRWNVHPRLSDNLLLVRSVRADAVIPAFCDLKHRAALEKALEPAELFLTTPVPL